MFTPARIFRVTAIAEAVTWALLIAGMLQKYVLDAGDWGVSIAGGVHGFVFLAYLAVGLVVSINQRLSAGTTLLILVSAIIPFATIPVEVRLVGSGRLDGQWRTEATADPRDSRPLDRLVRWWIARPKAFAAVLVVLIVAVFAILLIVGPPGGRNG